MELQQLLLAMQNRLKRILPYSYSSDLIILLFIGWFFRKVSIPFYQFFACDFWRELQHWPSYSSLRAKCQLLPWESDLYCWELLLIMHFIFIAFIRAKGSIEVVIRDMSISIAMCSLTSAIAFFSLLFVKSEVLRDLGLFAGLSILGAALFSLIILPHLIKIRNKTFEKRRNIHR